jgi:hypothetical protein
MRLASEDTSTGYAILSLSVRNEAADARLVVDVNVVFDGAVERSATFVTHVDINNNGAAQVQRAVYDHARVNVEERYGQSARRRLTREISLTRTSSGADFA